MAEFWQTRMGSIFFEGTIPRIATALEKIAATLTKEQPAPVEVWDDNSVQFPRLIAEVRSLLTVEQIQELSLSMDLSFSDLGELFLRADREWCKSKDKVIKG